MPLGLTTFFPGHFLFLMGYKLAILSLFMGFWWVGLVGSLDYFGIFFIKITGQLRLQTNTVTDKTVVKTSILFPLSFLEDIAVFIFDTDNYRYRLKQLVQIRNGSRKSRKFSYRFHRTANCPYSIVGQELFKATKPCCQLMKKSTLLTRLFVNCINCCDSSSVHGMRQEQETVQSSLLSVIW